MTVPDNHHITDAEPDDVFHEKIARLKTLRDALDKEHPLLLPLNSIIFNFEEMNKKKTLPTQQLIACSRAIEVIMHESHGGNTDHLLEALDQLDKLKSSMKNVALKAALYYFLTAIVLLIAATAIVLAAIQFPPALLIPTIALAMGITVIPAMSAVIPSFTLGGIIMNLLVGAGIAITQPPIWKYSRNTYRSWSYDHTVTLLEKTIAEKIQEDGAIAHLANQAQRVLTAIKHIKKTGNSAKGLHKLTESLNAVYEVLQDPYNAQKLQRIANIADNYSPKHTLLTKAYDLLMQALAPFAIIVVVLAFPLALIQTTGAVINSIATQFLNYVVPFSGFGIQPNSAVGAMALNNGMNSAGQEAVTKFPNIYQRLRSLLRLERSEMPLNQAIKELKIVLQNTSEMKLKSSSVKTEAMRQEIKAFRDALSDDQKKLIVPPVSKT